MEKEGSVAHRSKPSDGAWDGWIRSVSTSGLASYTKRTSDPRTQRTRRMGRRHLACNARFPRPRRRPRPTPRSIGRSTLHEPCTSDGGERTTLARAKGRTGSQGASSTLIVLHFPLPGTNLRTFLFAHSRRPQRNPTSPSPLRVNS